MILKLEKHITIELSLALICVLRRKDGIMDHICMDGYIYIRTSIWRDVGGESVLEEQYPELMKIYYYMVKIIKKGAREDMEKCHSLSMRFQRGIRFTTPIHDIFNNLFMRRIVLQRSERQPNF